MKYYALRKLPDGTEDIATIDGNLYSGNFELNLKEGKVIIPLKGKAEDIAFGPFLRCWFDPDLLTLEIIPWPQRYAARARDPAAADAIRRQQEAIDLGNQKLQEAKDFLLKARTLDPAAKTVLREVVKWFLPAQEDVTVMVSVSEALAAPDTVPVDVMASEGSRPRRRVTAMVDNGANRSLIEESIATGVGARDTGRFANVKGIGGIERGRIISLHVAIDKGRQPLGFEITAVAIPNLRAMAGFDLILDQAVRKTAAALGRPIA